MQYVNEQVSESRVQGSGSPQTQEKAKIQISICLAGVPTEGPSSTNTNPAKYFNQADFNGQNDNKDDDEEYDEQVSAEYNTKQTKKRGRASSIQVRMM